MRVKVSLIMKMKLEKFLIENEYPFALIKYLDENFDQSLKFTTKEASINIKKPDWIDK
jgi:hypothetical protein